jgi:hypothetical protein
VPAPAKTSINPMSKSLGSAKGHSENPALGEAGLSNGEAEGGSRALRK